MIKKGSVWTWSINCNNRLEDKLTEGKWVVIGTKEYLALMFPKINVLVEQGRIYKAKYSPKENLEDDPFPDSQPVMIIYADDKTKEKAREELMRLGMTPDFWKYEWETKRDWQPGGELYEKSNKTQGKKVCDEVLEHLCKQKDI
jgi:hypothetical protein